VNGQIGFMLKKHLTVGATPFRPGSASESVRYVKLLPASVRSTPEWVAVMGRLTRYQSQ